MYLHLHGRSGSRAEAVPAVQANLPGERGGIARLNHVADIAPVPRVPLRAVARRGRACASVGAEEAAGAPLDLQRALRPREIFEALAHAIGLVPVGAGAARAAVQALRGSGESRTGQLRSSGDAKGVGIRSLARARGTRAPQPRPRVPGLENGKLQRVALGEGGTHLCPARSPVQSTQVASAVPSPSLQLDAEAEASDTASSVASNVRRRVIVRQNLQDRRQARSELRRNVVAVSST